MVAANTIVRAGRPLACASLEWLIGPVVIPGRLCNGCTHLIRVLEGEPQWIMSKNCPCLECISARLLVLRDPEDPNRVTTMTDRLEHWTDGDVKGYAPDEWFDPAKLGRPTHSGAPRIRLVDL